MYVVQPLSGAAMYLEFTKKLHCRLHVHHSGGCARTSGASDWHYVFVITVIALGQTGLRKTKKVEGRHDRDYMGFMVGHLIDVVRVQTGWNLYMELFNVAPCASCCLQWGYQLHTALS